MGSNCSTKSRLKNLRIVYQYDILQNKVKIKEILWENHLRESSPTDIMMRALN